MDADSEGVVLPYLSCTEKLKVQKITYNVLFSYLLCTSQSLLSWQNHLHPLADCPASDPCQTDTDHITSHAPSMKQGMNLSLKEMDSPVNYFVLVEKLQAEQHAGRIKPESRQREIEVIQTSLNFCWMSLKLFTYVMVYWAMSANRACFSLKMLVWMCVMRSPPGE